MDAWHCPCTLKIHRFKMFQGLSSLTSDLNTVQAVHGSPQQVWHLTTLLSGVSATWQPNPCPFCFLALVSGDKAGNPSILREQNLTSQEALPADSFRGPIYGRLFLMASQLFGNVKRQTSYVLLSHPLQITKKGLTSIANNLRLPCPSIFFVYSKRPRALVSWAFLTLKTMNIQGRSSRIMR